MIWKPFLLACLTINLLLGQICPKTLSFLPPRHVDGRELMSHADLWRCPTDTQSHVMSQRTSITAAANSPCADGRCLRAATVSSALFPHAHREHHVATSIVPQDTHQSPWSYAPLIPTPTESPPLRSILQSIVMLT